MIRLYHAMYLNALQILSSVVAGSVLSAPGYLSPADAIRGIQAVGATSRPGVSLPRYLYVRYLGVHEGVAWLFSACIWAGFTGT